MDIIDKQIQPVVLDIHSVSEQVDSMLSRLEKKTPENSLIRAITGGSKREIYLAQLEAKKAHRKLHRKKYTRKPGHVHPMKKAATKRRRYRYMWAQHPYSCIMSGAAPCSIKKAEWEEWMTPLWQKYLPEELSVQRVHRSKSYSLFNIQVVHKELGLVYDGRAQEVWLASGGEGYAR